MIRIVFTVKEKSVITGLVILVVAVGVFVTSVQSHLSEQAEASQAFESTAQQARLKAEPFCYSFGIKFKMSDEGYRVPVYAPSEDRHDIIAFALEYYSTSSQKDAPSMSEFDYVMENKILEVFEFSKDSSEAVVRVRDFLSWSQMEADLVYRKNNSKGEEPGTPVQEGRLGVSNFDYLTERFGRAALAEYSQFRCEYELGYDLV